MAESTTDSTTEGTTKSATKEATLVELPPERAMVPASLADLDALEARIHRLELACANHGVK